MSAGRAFVLGCISMLVNSSTFIIFISGLHTISRSNVEILDEVLSLFILTAFTLTTVLVPMAIYFVFPSKSERALAALQGWLTKHKRLIGTATLLVFGVYLVVKGLTAVV
jgi:uncharacterized membrane protein YozB (DUF420 family)